ncbi:hypothetical protein SAMN04488128_1011167 [Chitinophaga eiseniae]|uniref:Uncharacterized protein n=1 Tax=Chitinophaga eiseniae TaxID=634771 RepID=A0A1T4MMC5_9BACT|nr:hypothetical protein [Chitinophaga eiseniae]SJZ67976.1 hypothetical protein SAMN04488128_1011167 [Chitinophaga eiseniae]
MKRTVPVAKVIIGYKDVLDAEPPADRISLLDGICRHIVLAEIAGLNYRIKPRTQMYHNTSFDFQKDELLYFCGFNNAIYRKVTVPISKFAAKIHAEPLIFTRPACLFAIEEILQSDLPEVPGFTMRDSWEKLFHYLLAVNTRITALSDKKEPEEDADQGEGKSSVGTIEKLNPRMLPLNELEVETNPVYTPYRGYRLMKYISTHATLSAHFIRYIKEKYDMEWPRFIFEILSMYFANNVGGVNDVVVEGVNRKIDTSFIFHAKDDTAKFLNTLSGVVANANPETLLSIKKNPLYLYEPGSFALVDHVLLLDKTYYQLINDFWFDAIKPLKGPSGKDLFTVKDYRATIGLFFESYLREIFSYSFEKANYNVLKMFDDLKVKSGKNVVELADVYMRDKKRIFLAQAKTTGIYDKEKYSGNLDGLYRKDRDEFFKSFGLEQIVSSIKSLEDLALQIDPKFPIGKVYKIYPAILVNEKAMQTPLMAHIFNKRFQEMISELKNNKVTIAPLAIIHVSDLEYIEEALHDDHSQFFKILDYHNRFPTFMPPFYNSLKHLNIKQKLDNRAMKQIEELIGIYNPGSDEAKTA